MKESQFGDSFESISRMSIQDTSTRSPIESCLELSSFLITYSKLDIGTCILSQSKGCGFENLSGGTQPPNSCFPPHAKVCNRSVYFHLFTNIDKDGSIEL